MLYPYEFVTDEATNAAVLKYGSNETYRGEELVAFVLSYAKQISEAHAGSAIKVGLCALIRHSPSRSAREDARGSACS